MPKKYVLLLTLILVVLAGCSPTVPQEVAPSESICGEEILKEDDVAPKEPIEWEGTYLYMEEMAGDSLSSANPVWHHQIKVYREKGAYVADISVDGWQTNVKVRADGAEEGDELRLHYREALPGNKWESPRAEARLLTLHMSEEGLLTTWGALKPCVERNDRGGVTHFVKCDDWKDTFVNNIRYFEQDGKYSHENAYGIELGHQYDEPYRFITNYALVRQGILWKVIDYLGYAASSSNSPEVYIDGQVIPLVEFDFADIDEDEVLVTMDYDYIFLSRNGQLRLPPETLEQGQFMRRQAIQRGGALYQFELAYDLEAYEFTFTVPFQIDIFTPDGVHIQTIEETFQSDADWAFMSQMPKQWKFADINFDGYTDILYPVWMGGIKLNTTYGGWVWNPERNQFEEVQLGELRNIWVDEEHEVLWSVGVGTYSSRDYRGFSLIDGEYVLTHYLEFSIYGGPYNSETGEVFSNYAPVYGRNWGIDVRELVDGVMTPVFPEVICDTEEGRAAVYEHLYGEGSVYNGIISP